MSNYLLLCGHRASVPGPHGATTGRAWCVTCGESVGVAAPDDQDQGDGCPRCGSPVAVLLGFMGRVEWRRCRYCGRDYSV